jgi:hypothetical protein
MEILAGSLHDGLKAALPYWTWAAVLGVLCALIYYGGRALERKYPHLKKEKKPRKGKKK